MRQAVLAAPKTLRWTEGPTPEPGRGEVVVRIRAALTCGTDLKTYRRGHPKLAFGPFGHEAAGDVHAVGEGVSSVGVGEPVMWVQTAPCGACDRCTSGRENLCAHLTAGMALGAYADYLRLPAAIVARNLYPKPPQLSYIEAAFLEPFSCVVHGWRILDESNGGRNIDHPVAIVGAGGIGLLHLAFARHRGIAATVFARDSERASLAQRLGAADVLAPEAMTAREASFAAVIDCGGTAQSWKDAIRLTAAGGRTLLFSGLPESETFPLDAGRLHYDELTLLGSFHFTPADVREARRLLLAGVVPAKELIAAVSPLDALEDVFATLDRGGGRKFALVPPPDAARWQ